MKVHVTYAKDDEVWSHVETFDAPPRVGDLIAHVSQWDGFRVTQVVHVFDQHEEVQYQVLAEAAELPQTMKLRSTDAS